MPGEHLRVGQRGSSIPGFRHRTGGYSGIQILTKLSHSLSLSCPHSHVCWFLPMPLFTPALRHTLVKLPRPRPRPGPSPTRHLHASLQAKMRLPYVADPPPTTSPEEAAIVERIQARRAPRPLTSLDLALLHSPPVADGWNAFLGAVRTRTNIADDVRELAICRVAVVNEAWYEWMHHAPLAVKAGVSEAAMEVLKKQGPVTLADRPQDGAAGFEEKQWAAIVIADEMTRNVHVADETFAAVKALFGERETVEMVATVACYNCVSRFLVALDGESQSFNLFAPLHECGH